MEKNINEVNFLDPSAEKLKGISNIWTHAWEVI